jgi:mandelate racemase
VGRATAPYDLMAAMDAKFRLLGWQGLVGMAVCGGITGWLRVAGQAEAASIPMSSHLFAAHMLAVTPTAHWLEFLDFAGAILAKPAEIVDGTVTARGPGLRLECNEAAVAKYLIS